MSPRSFAAWARRIGWQAPAELLGMADEQKTLTIAEGNANVEPRQDISVTNPLGEPWWNLLQTVGWVGFRERNLVWRSRDGVMEDCQIQPLNGDDEAWAASEDESLSQLLLDDLAVEFARRNEVALCTFEEAEAAVVAKLREKRLWAVAFHNERTVKIPMARWVLHPLFWDGPKYSAPHEPRTIPWQEIRFPREQVLMLWPEVSESCLRDGASAPAEGNANVKPPESSLLPFQAPDRQDDWVRVISAMKTEFES